MLFNYSLLNLMCDEGATFTLVATVLSYNLLPIIFVGICKALTGSNNSRDVCRH